MCPAFNHATHSRLTLPTHHQHVALADARTRTRPRRCPILRNSPSQRGRRDRGLAGPDESDMGHRAAGSTSGGDVNQCLVDAPPT
jgi:hypothetical protein